MAQTVKNPPAMHDTRVQSLGREDPVKKGMATTPVFLPGEFLGQRSLAGYSPWGPKQSDNTEQLTHTQWIICLSSRGIGINSYLDPEECCVLTLFPPEVATNLRNKSRCPFK